MRKRYDDTFKQDAVNLLVTSDGRVKLLDFGLARSANVERQTGSLSGTPHYVAPERIRGDPATPQSDIYGVGKTLYELSAHAKINSGLSSEEVCNSIGAKSGA